MKEGDKYKLSATWEVSDSETSFWGISKFRSVSVAEDSYKVLFRNDSDSTANLIDDGKVVEWQSYKDNNFN